MVTASSVSGLITFVVLVGVCLLAFFSRLFAIIRYESIIHEFDPWFNYRATFKMVNMGFYDFLNWFDETAWHPLGRVVGGTVYPGLMITAGGIHHFLNFLGFTNSIQDICVFTAPIFAGFTSIATYLLTTELWSPGAGLIGALFMSIIPGYTQRSVAGSFDNEGISIFALQITFYAWVKASRLGSVTWSVLTAALYLYMTSAWGGYVFIINMIALHTFVLILTRNYSERLYVSYTTFYCIGQLMAMNIPFVGFQPLTTSEHMASFGVFGLIQLAALHKKIMTNFDEVARRRILIVLIVTIVGIGVGGIVALVAAGVVAPWSGRFYSLWDTQYARIHLPLISSVSEHQPTNYWSYFLDLHALPMLAGAGLWYISMDLTPSRMFIVINCTLAAYFSGVMVRLMLTLAPVFCVLGAIACSVSLERIFDDKGENQVQSDQSDDRPESDSPEPNVAPSRRLKVNMSKSPILIRAGALVAFVGFFAHFTYHSTFATSNMYSSPSIILTGRKADGSPHVIDDWREAYYWLRQNTNPDTAIMSWWDYGYQIAGMADRPTVIDNNTWNNTHIALVGKAFSSDEEKAHEIARYLGVEYVLVFFGGYLGYGGDDMNKFLWMVRIAQGEFPEIQEKDFKSARGQYKWDAESISPTMKKCLMYKLSYYRFAEMNTGKLGYDKARGVEIGHKKFKLKYFEEAFTTESWLLRIYRVKKPEEISKNHGAKLKGSKTPKAKKQKIKFNKMKLRFTQTGERSRKKPSFSL